MKQIVVQVPDDKVRFYEELFKELGLQCAHFAQAEQLTEEQKQGLSEAIHQADNGDIITMDKMEAQLIKWQQK